MDTAAIKLIGAILTSALVIIVGAVARRARVRPNISSEAPSRMRLPRIVPFAGIIIFIPGLMILLLGIPAGDPEDIVPMTTAGIAMVLGGLFFIWLYRRWYVDIRPDRVIFRGFAGEKTILYHEIINYRFYQQNGKPNLRVKSANGATLNLDLATFDGSYLLQYIAWLEQGQPDVPTPAAAPVQLQAFMPPPPQTSPEYWNTTAAEVDTYDLLHSAGGATATGPIAGPVPTVNGPVSTGPTGLSATPPTSPMQATPPHASTNPQADNAQASSAWGNKKDNRHQGPFYSR